MKSLSRVRLFVTTWTVAYQAPLSMGFSRQEYWSGLPFPSPGVLYNSGIEPRSPTLQADALSSKPPGKPQNGYRNCLKGIVKNSSSLWDLCHWLDDGTSYLDKTERLSDWDEGFNILHLVAGGSIWDNIFTCFLSLLNNWENCIFQLTRI